MSEEAKKQKKERTVAVKKQKKDKEDTIESRKKNELLPLLTTTVLEYTSKAKTTEQADLISVIQKELKVTYLR